MTKVRVVSDGFGPVEIYADDVKLTNVTALTIHPLDGTNRHVRISIEMVNVALDLRGDLVHFERLENGGSTGILGNLRKLR